jgi:hypothetical protein
VTAEFSKGEARYSDRSSLAQDLERFLRNGILYVRGEHFPPLLEDFRFAFYLPDGTKLDLRGQLISLRGPMAMIQIADWTKPSGTTDRLRLPLRIDTTPPLLPGKPTAFRQLRFVEV